MAIFGLMTQKEAQAAIVEAVKAAMLKDMPRWLAQEADAEKFNLPDPSVYGNQADLFRKLSWVLQAVDITAQSVAVSKFSVARELPGKEPKDIPAHPFEMLLKHPNPLDSRFEFLYGTSAYWSLTGNCYWWMNRVNENAAPDEIWILPSHMIQPIPDERMFIRGYYYYPGNGSELILEPWEVVHYRRFNPFSRFVGLSAIEAVAMTAAGLLGMQAWNTKLFAENNARLPGILTFEQMVEDGIWDKIKNDTREASKKRELMMLRGVGQGGVNWLQNAVSQKEMEFLDGIRAGAKEIMDTLAPGLYTWLSGESTYSNAGANRAAFNELTLYPRHVMMAEKITNEILPTYAKNSPSPERSLVGMFEDVRFVDRELKLREQEAFEKTHTLEEVRLEYYQDDPLGDDRDKLLPSQINAQSGGIQEPPPSPFAKPETEQSAPKDEMKPDEMMKEPMPGEPKEDDSMKAALDDLARFQRKAVKRVGKPVEFESDYIPGAVLSSIHTRLTTCTSETAVKAVFDNARDELKPRAAVKASDAAAVLEGIRLALGALALQK
jgi:phage portal protein BeeE